MSLLNWKIGFAVYFGLLWMLSVAVNIMGVIHTWGQGYGRVWQLLPENIELSPGIVSLPLVLLFLVVLQPFKDMVFKNLHFFSLGLVALTVCTGCATFVIAVVQDNITKDLSLKLETLLKNEYGHSMANNYNASLVFTQSMDYVQNKFKCCGVHGDGDYLNSNWHRIGDAHGKERNVPPSCCVPETEGAANTNNISHSGSPISVVSRVFYNMLEEGWQRPQPKDRVSCQSSNEYIHKQARYKQGCINLTEKWLKTNITMTVFIGIGVCILQMIGVILGFILKRKFDEAEAEVAQPENA